jgi:Ca2+-binding RTX toxin-like protein
LSVVLLGSGCSSSDANPGSDSTSSDQQALGEDFASCTGGTGWTASSGTLIVDASATTSHSIIFSPGGGVVKVNGRTCKDTSAAAISLGSVKSITLKGAATAKDTFVLDFTLGMPVGSLLSANGIIVDGQETTTTVTPDMVIVKGSTAADLLTLGKSATYATDQTVAVALTSASKVANISIRKTGDIADTNPPDLVFILGKGNDNFNALGGFVSTTAVSFPLTVFGGDGDDIIAGGMGNDTLSGGAGNDTFVSAAKDGADSIDGGGDYGDLVDYSGRSNAHPVKVDLNSTVVKVWGGNLRGVTMGTDTLDIDPGSGTSATVTFASEATPIAIRDAINATTGLTGVASLVGTYLVLQSTGVNGDVIVNDNSDTAAGLLGLVNGDTTAIGNDGEGNESDDIQKVANVYGSAGADVLVGSSVSNTLDGKAGDDTLNGGPLNATCANDVDVLKGDVGNDWFDMGSSQDCNQTVSDSGGLDVVDYSKRTAAVTIKIDTTSASGATGSMEADKIAQEVEIVLGSAFNDTITGNGSANYLFGGAGVDTINAGPGNDQVWGGTGNDNLNGESGDDTFYELSAYQGAGATNDPLSSIGTPSGKWAKLGLQIYGATKPGDGNDVINGGVGTDKIDLSDATAAVTVTLCLDTAGTGVTNTTGCGTGATYGADDNDGLTGNTANNYVNVEWIAGGPISNILIGTSADETFEGGAGVDVILGQGGSDNIYGFKDASTDATSADILCGGDGDDTITGGGAAIVAGEGQMRTAGAVTNVLPANSGDASAHDPELCATAAQTYSIDASGQNICFGGATYASCVNN